MGCDLVTVRQLLTLTHPHLLRAVRAAPKDEQAEGGIQEGNKLAVETLLKAMANTKTEYPFGEILAGIGRRFLSTPHTERGSIFSTAAVQTDFLDSLPVRAISRRSNFSLADLRGDRPTTIFICVPEGRANQFRWTRLLVQLACTTLEQMGPYPRDRTPILFMAEEFAGLQHMAIMERAAAYFPGFGVKLWAILQDLTQLQRHYPSGWQTFLGNAGILQGFANGDAAMLDYVARRLDKLIAPFELRTAFSRKQTSQLLMIEGEPPAAALRLEHDDVANIRAWAIAGAWELHRNRRQ
jgi:type IV secretion system protein VirD4